MTTTSFSTAIAREIKIEANKAERRIHRADKKGECIWNPRNGLALLLVHFARKAISSRFMN
jgi:hypothetical protein